MNASSSSSGEPSLCVAGESFEDIVFHRLPRLPRLGEELRTPHVLRTYGGGVLITAVAAARLGTPCRVVSALPNGATSMLAQESIEFVDVRRSHEPHAMTVALSTLHERAFVTYVGVNETAEQRVLAACAAVDCAHLHLALTPRAFSEWGELVRAMRARGTSVSIDAGYDESLASESYASLVAEMDVVFVNEAEARMYSRADAWDGVVRHWRTHARTTVIKRGAQGASAVDADGETATTAIPTDVVDTTGAGDAFNGGFLHARLRGEPLRTCLEFGAKVASFSVRRPGGLEGLPRARELW